MKRYKSGMRAPVVAEPQQIETSTPVISPDGTVGTISSAEIPQAIESGYQLATPAALKLNTEKNEYGRGVINELEAGALGLLRGSSLGLSDVALRKINPAWADSAEKLKRYNPDASLAGEIGSFLAPGVGQLVGLGSAAKGAGFLQGLVSKGGAELGDIAAGIVGKNLAGTIAGGATRFATEAALYQAAHNVSEAALQDKDLTAEAILANTGHAAILGAGIGGLIPAVARGTQAIAESSPVRGVVSGASKQFAKFFDPQRNLQLFTGAMKNELNAEKGARFQSAVKELSKDSGVSLYAPGEVALDPLTAKIAKVGGGGLPSQEGAFDRVQKIKSQAANLMSDISKQADDITAATGLVSRADSLSADVLGSEANGTGLLGKINQWEANTRITPQMASVMRGDIERVGAAIDSKAGNIRGLHELRMDLDSKIGPKNWDKLASEEIEITKDLRRVVSKTIDGQLAELAEAKLVPANTLEKWKDVNRLYGNLKTIEKPLADAYARANANVNVLGLRIRDIGIGAIGGGVLGGPAGVAIGLANKAMQTDRGLLVRAGIGERLQKLAWADQLTQKSQSEISASIKDFLSGTDTAKLASKAFGEVSAPIAYAMTGSAKPAKRDESQQKWFDDTRKQILAVAQSPEDWAGDFGKQAQPLADAAPMVADAVTGKALEVYSYLAKVMPKNPGMPLSLFNDPWKPADYEVQNFRKIVQVARAPLSILEDLKKGTVTIQQVDAVKTLYPRLYESVLTKVQQTINEPDTKVTYDQQLKLGQLFPGVVPSLNPSFVAAMQTPAAKPEKPNAPGGKITYSSRRQSASDRGEAR